MIPQHLQFVSASKSVKSVADERLLVTSNDSRVRLYRLVCVLALPAQLCVSSRLIVSLPDVSNSDMAVELKFKGHQNDTSQIAATFSDDGRWIICGSEDGNCFLWSTDWPRDGNEGSRHLQFQADDTLVSVRRPVCFFESSIVLTVMGFDHSVPLSHLSTPDCSSRPPETRSTSSLAGRCLFLAPARPSQVPTRSRLSCGRSASSTRRRRLAWSWRGRSRGLFRGLRSGTQSWKRCSTLL